MKIVLYKIYRSLLTKKLSSTSFGVYKFESYQFLIMPSMYLTGFDVPVLSLTYSYAQSIISGLILYLFIISIILIFSLGSRYRPTILFIELNIFLILGFSEVDTTLSVLDFIDELLLNI
ncbi:hypothetical protein QOS_2904, partial [Clostridioides difficile Y184]